MRDDFAIFILTHGRADHVFTMDTLRRQGYTGRWYMILDDEDDQAPEYIRRFGKDHIIIFNKREVYDRIDTMDNFHEHRAIVYARNEAYKIAADLGLTYFLMLDDDYTRFQYRFLDGDKLRGVSPIGEPLEQVFEAMIKFLEDTGSRIVAFAQVGDMLGGASSPRYFATFLRKCMNTMFCKTDLPVEFSGTMNEDITTYTTLGSRGELFFTFTHFQIVQKETQSLSGGMMALYQESGTYVKSFYSVMSMPSAVKVSMMYSKHRRIHSKIDWGSCVPKIIHERWRKEG